MRHWPPKSRRNTSTRRCNVSAPYRCNHECTPGYYSTIRRDRDGIVRIGRSATAPGSRLGVVAIRCDPKGATERPPARGGAAGAGVVATPPPPSPTPATAAGAAAGVAAPAPLTERATDGSPTHESAGRSCCWSVATSPPMPYWGRLPPVCWRPQQGLWLAQLALRIARMANFASSDVAAPYQRVWCGWTASRIWRGDVYASSGRGWWRSVCASSGRSPRGSVLRHLPVRL